MLNGRAKFGGAVHRGDNSHDERLLSVLRTVMEFVDPTLGSLGTIPEAVVQTHITLTASMTLSLWGCCWYKQRLQITTGVHSAVLGGM